MLHAYVYQAIEFENHRVCFVYINIIVLFIYKVVEHRNSILKQEKHKKGRVNSGTDREIRLLFSLFA